ncbi:RsmE family RNA methyltransferase [Desulfobacterota bacterium M19]
MFVNPEDLTSKEVVVRGSEARHLSRVLRLKAGARIEVFDGSGLVCLAEITKMSRSGIHGQILSSRRVGLEPPFLTLAMAVLKGRKMDMVIQKATELGARELIPLLSANCAAPPPVDSQRRRWQRISLEACKQCGRPSPLICGRVLTCAELMDRVPEFDERFIFWEDERRHGLPVVIPAACRSMLIIVGPEGGFTNDEVTSAREHGCSSTGLGNLILRAETAAIAGMAVCQFMLGNLGLSRGNS